jgi:hypothetical protein
MATFRITSANAKNAQKGLLCGAGSSFGETGKPPAPADMAVRMQTGGAQVSVCEPVYSVVIRNIGHADFERALPRWRSSAAFSRQKMPMPLVLRTASQILARGATGLRAEIVAAGAVGSCFVRPKWLMLDGLVICRSPCGSRGKRMSWGASPLAGVILVLACTSGAVTDPARTPLTSLGITETIDALPDPDDPGVGGGFDAANYFKNVLASTVASCTTKIAAAADSWIGAQQLVSVLRDAGPDHLLIHTSKPGDAGFFEISYRFSFGAKRARVTVFYVAGDGRLLEPAAITAVLNNNEIGPFQEALEKAVRCGDLG